MNIRLMVLITTLFLAALGLYTLTRSPEEKPVTFTDEEFRNIQEAQRAAAIEADRIAQAPPQSFPQAESDWLRDQRENADANNKYRADIAKAKAEAEKIVQEAARRDATAHREAQIETFRQFRYNGK